MKKRLERTRAARVERRKRQVKKKSFASSRSLLSLFSPSNLTPGNDRLLLHGLRCERKKGRSGGKEEEEVNVSGQNKKKPGAQDVTTDAAHSKKKTKRDSAISPATAPKKATTATTTRAETRILGFWCVCVWRGGGEGELRASAEERVGAFSRQ